MKCVETYRISRGTGTESPPGAPYGMFHIKLDRIILGVVASDGDELIRWDHVSVSLEHRCPTWQEMCYIKRLFFKPDEVVMQLHPADKNHINTHPNCLHLWRPHDSVIPLPPLEAV